MATALSISMRLSGNGTRQVGFSCRFGGTPDRAGTVDVGFLVENVDRAYERALEIGAGDVSGPRDIEGMPRTAQITDPSGNHIGLYQG